MLALSLIIAGILLRFAPHAPNFTPVAAIALFGGAYLNKKYAVIIPLALMIVSDLFIGMHNVVFFTWGSFILIALLGFRLKENKSIFRLALTSVTSSVLFYFITNFGVWAMGWYPSTLRGLAECYIMGLPFLRDFTAATLIYTSVLFLAYKLIFDLVKETKLAKVLLTK